MSGEWYRSSSRILAHSEETDSWSPKKPVDLEYDGTMEEVSIPNEGCKESRISERDEGKFSEVEEWGWAWWRNNAKTDLDVDFARTEDDDWIDLDLKI